MHSADALELEENLHKLKQLGQGTGLNESAQKRMIGEVRDQHPSNVKGVAKNEGAAR